MADGWDPTKFNPHDPAFLADPYPIYTLFRDSDPIFAVKPYGSDWMFRYADCKAVLDSSAQDVWINHPPGGQPSAPGPYGVMENFPDGIFGSDPPLHTQLRSILEPVLRDAITTAPQLAAQLAGPLLEAAAARGRMELITSYAVPLPAHVLFTLLGIPDDPGVWAGLISWASVIAAAHDITQSLQIHFGGMTAGMALHTFFEGMRLRGEPGSGLFANMCAAFAKAGLQPPEVQACAVNFLVAGYLSTTFLIGTGVRNLLRNPDQLAKLRADPGLIDGAIDEMLRIDGPVQVIDRYAALDTEIGGRSYAQNSKVTAVVGAADHDPAVFPEPECFDIERQSTAPHMGFGAGIHTCIGAPLVRLVAPVAINMLLERFPDLALDGDPQWQTDPYLRAVTSLPLRF